MKVERIDGKSTNKGEGLAIKEAFKANTKEQLSEIQQKVKYLRQTKKILQIELATIQRKKESDKQIEKNKQERLESENKAQEFKVKAEKEADDVRDLQQQINELFASMSEDTSASGDHEAILCYKDGKRVEVTTDNKKFIVLLWGWM